MALQRGEQDVAQPIRDVRTVRRSAAERTPDLLVARRSHDKHPVREILAKISGQLGSPMRQRRIHQAQQLGIQPAL